MKYGYLILAHDPFMNTWSVPLVDIDTFNQAKAISRIWIYKVLDQSTYPFWVTDQNKREVDRREFELGAVTNQREEIRFHICQYKGERVEVGLTPKAMYLLKRYECKRSGTSSWYAESFKPVRETTNDGVSVLSFDDSDKRRIHLDLEALKDVATAQGLLPELEATQMDWVQNAISRS